MLTAVIPVSDDNKNVKTQIQIANHSADAIEFRLDYLTKLNIDAIANIYQTSTLPTIFTLRKKSQGGCYPNTEHQRLQDILLLCGLNPAYFDIEYDISLPFLQEISARFPNIKLICSYHNFAETPEDLPLLLRSMQKNHFYSYKIATQANNTIDALRMLHFVRHRSTSTILTGICMGNEGQCTRILSPIIGNAMHYASIDDASLTAQGQLTIHELLERYHLRKLDKHSKIYALLGDPIDLSIGHIFHNRVIELLNQNAVYIKLKTTQQNLAKVLELIKQLPFFGLSITMPLKECIVPLLDKIDISSQPIKAINSVIYFKKKWIGFNTDGIGAMRALAHQVDISKQTIVILGAGGAARAIAYQALHYKAKVIILNRTLEKAKRLAKELGCECHHLSDLNKLKNYTILINTLPEKVYLKNTILESTDISPNIVAMDIVYRSTDTCFLKIARQAHCICISGYETYFYQGLQQIERWHGVNGEDLIKLGLKSRPKGE